MPTPKSKADREVHSFLLTHLSDKYHIYYKTHFIEVEHSSLKIDFLLVLKQEFITDLKRPIVYYIQNGKDASLRKMTQIYDLLLSFTSVSIIWETKDIQYKLIPLSKKLNDLIDIPPDALLSQGLLFLMLCDSQDESELIKYRSRVNRFMQSLQELEMDHGCALPEEVEDEDTTEEEV